MVTIDDLMLKPASTLLGALSALLLSAPVDAGGSPDNGALIRGDYWVMWMKATRRECPGNHLEWAGMSDFADDLVGGFDSTLSHDDQNRIAAFADYSNRCRQEMGGFTCELSVHVDAYNRLGMLKRFAKFGCESYDCRRDEVCKPLVTRR